MQLSWRPATSMSCSNTWAVIGPTGFAWHRGATPAATVSCGSLCKTGTHEYSPRAQVVYSFSFLFWTGREVAGTGARKGCVAQSVGGGGEIPGFSFGSAKHATRHSLGSCVVKRTPPPRVCLDSKLVRATKDELLVLLALLDLCCSLPCSRARRDPCSATNQLAHLREKHPASTHPLTALDDGSCTTVQWSFSSQNDGTR